MMYGAQENLEHFPIITRYHYKKKDNSTFCACCACVLWSFLKTLALENLIDLIPELRHISYLKIVCLREVCCDL